MAISFLLSPIHDFTVFLDDYHRWPREAGARILAAQFGYVAREDPVETAAVATWVFRGRIVAKARLGDIVVSFKTRNSRQLRCG